MEIGSIYEIAPDSLNGFNKDNEYEVSLGELGEIKKYNKKYYAYTASGREAIALALKTIAKSEPKLSKKCLLPAYMCDTVFFPFENEGWEIYFYHVNKKLEVNEEELRSLIEKIRPQLLFIHPYYGVDTWKSLRPLLIELKNQGICIMEDVTQSYYLENAGIEADYVIGSLRKWYPVPDGGFVASDEELAEETVKEDAEQAGLRLRVLMDKWDYLYGNQEPEEKKVNKAAYLKRNRELENLLDTYLEIRKISNETAHILKRENEDKAKKQRNENYRYLYDKLCKELKNRALFEPIITVSGDGKACQNGTDAAPLYFAVYVNDRDELQSFLSARGIYAPVLWPIGKENEGFLTADERYIFEHMLALPIDQRYGREEMEYIAETVENHIGYETAAKNRILFGIPEVVGVRADVNDEVGMGHIMRCITIAKQLKKLGKEVIFFTADENGKELLQQAGMEWICLHSEWNNMESEIHSLKAALEENNCFKLVVDSYQASIKYFRELLKLCKLIYIDDCFEEIYPVDMVINYNAYHIRFNYGEAYHNKAKLLLGTAYVPLREEFQREHTAEDSGGFKQDCISGDGSVVSNQVLISSGGGDVYNALAAILSEALKDEELKKVIFHTVVGKFNPNTGELKQLAKEHENIKLHNDVKNMSELMSRCGAAVSAAGTMLFELSAMRVPTVFFVSADNQQYDSEFFAKEERMLFAGDIRADRDGCIGNVCMKLKELLKDDELRERMKKALYEVTDGKGAERIAEAIAGL